MIISDGTVAFIHDRHHRHYRLSSVQHCEPQIVHEGRCSAILLNDQTKAKVKGKATSVVKANKVTEKF